MKTTFDQKRIVSLILRIGLAFAFFYASLAAFVSPNDWVGYLPQVIRNIVPGTTILPIFSSLELILAVWLLSSWRLTYAALAAAAMLGGIVILDPALLSITFRDVSLVFMAIALYALELEPQPSIKK